MELRDLRSFVAVAEELHFGRAAKRLHISPPPLSQRIKALENELGVSLFTRSKRNVALTAAGSALLSEVRRLCLRAEELPRLARQAARGGTGELRIGVVASAVYSQAGVLVANVARAMPNTTFVWRVSSSIEQIQAIRENHLDLGVINTPIEHDGLLATPLVREQLVVAMPATHKYASRASIALRLLRDETFVIGERQLAPTYYDRVLTAFNAAGFSPIIEHQSQSIISFIGLVAIGAGLAVVPAYLARAGLAEVVFVPIEGKAPSTELSLLWDPRNDSAILAEALKLIELTR